MTIKVGSIVSHTSGQELERKKKNDEKLQRKLAKKDLASEPAPDQLSPEDVIE